MASKQSKPLHAIVIFPPYQGHINPFLYLSLSLKIASKGLTLTFVPLDFVHHKLSKAANNPNHNDIDFFYEARASGLDIRYGTISDDFPLDFDRELNYGVYWDYMFRKFPSHVEEFVGKMIRSDPSFAYFLIGDHIHVWPDNSLSMV